METEPGKPSPHELLRGHFAPAPLEEIVLAQETFALVERNTLGFAREAARLARLGLSQKKGVLLYGPPGTGKTLIVRWLIGARMLGADQKVGFAAAV